MLTLPEQRAFEDALRADCPTTALADVVRDLLNRSGATKQELLSGLEEFRGILRRRGMDADEDVVLEVMDFLVGWASPHMSMTADGDT